MLNEAYTVKQFHSVPHDDAASLCLSLLISPGSFIYAISTQQFKTVVELCSVQFTAAHTAVTSLQESTAFLIQNYLLDRKKFEKVNIALLNTDFAMIPEAYATQDVLKPLLKFTTGEPAVKNVWQHTLNGIKFCYTPDDELGRYLERAFPNASVRHAGAVSIQLFSVHHTLKSCQVFLHVHEGFIELAAKRNNDLLFYNIFNYDTGEDILYYLLFMLEQFDVDPTVITLGIAGQKQADDDLVKQIKKYIPNLHFCTSHPSVTLSGELAQLPAHFYFTVLNQHLCEL